MATLPRLAELKLNLQCNFDEEDLVTVIKEAMHHSSLRAPLRSVTTLQLNLLHSQLEVHHFALTFAKLFPALQQIEIRSEQAEFLRQIDQCIFGLFARLQSWRLCPNAAVTRPV